GLGIIPYAGAVVAGHVVGRVQGRWIASDAPSGRRSRYFLRRNRAQLPVRSYDLILDAPRNKSPGPRRVVAVAVAKSLDEHLLFFRRANYEQSHDNEAA